MTEGPLVTVGDVERMYGYSPGSVRSQVYRRPESWPRPVSRRGHMWLYRLADMQARLGPPPTEGEVREEQRVQCLTCGRWYRTLGSHITRKHGITTDEYRAEHRLPAGYPLSAPEQVDIIGERTRQRMADDPGWWDRQRAKNLPLAELRRRSAEARAGTDELPMVQRARRRGTDAMQVAKLARQAERLAAAGFDSVEAAVRATEGWTASRAARRLGVEQSTVHRWRRQIRG